MSNVVSYKCPSCGAPSEFDIQKQNWGCKFCLSEYTLAELQGQGAQTVADTGPVQVQCEAYGSDAAAYSCPSCGGKIITDQTTVATFCVYCHNPTVIASRLSGEYQPARVLPFKLEKPEVMQAMTRLMRRRPLLPKCFREVVEKGEISGLYVPFWLFSADMQAYLAAQGLRVKVWSDMNYRYTKTDTFHVERAANVTFVDLPADGSTKLDTRLTQALEPFDYNCMREFSMGYLSGHFAESYDVDADEASLHAFGRMDAGARQMMQGLVRGYTSYHVTAQHSSRTRTDCTYVMLPVWTLVAEYKGKRYTFAMNGQTGKMVGKLPVSVGKAFAWFGGIAAAVSVLAFVGGMLI